MTEHLEQKKLVEYCHWNKILFFAIPNGQAMSGFNRLAAIKIVKKLKEEGMQSGVPDLFFPIVTDKGGLFIEMKRKGGKVSDFQKDWIKKLNSAGYQANICYSADEAIIVLKQYMKRITEYNGHPVTVL